MEQTIIAHTPIQFSKLSYQIVTGHKNKKKWLNGVNILLEDKIIEKIKLNNVEFDQNKALMIAFDFIQKKLTTKKQKVNRTAQAKAASSLIKDLNI